MSLWRSITCPSASMTGGQSAIFFPPRNSSFNSKAPHRITTPGRVNLMPRLSPFSSRLRSAVSFRGAKWRRWKGKSQVSTGERVFELLTSLSGQRLLIDDLDDFAGIGLLVEL